MYTPTKRSKIPPFGRLGLATKTKVTVESVGVSDEL